MTRPEGDAWAHGYRQGVSSVTGYFRASVAAQHLAISITTLKQWAEDGRIKYVDTQLGRLYEPDSVRELARLRRETV